MFEGWENFYLMIGSSAAALIGLMFVVMTLTAGRDRGEVDQGKRLYTSPIVWHLAVVMALSGAATAPMINLRLFGTAAGGLAILGLGIGIRSAVGIWRTRMSGADSAFDMWWYGLVPAIVYVGLAVASLGIFGAAKWGASTFAAALMALLLLSIHAEWDLVTFLAPRASPPDPSASKKKR